MVAGSAPAHSALSALSAVASAPTAPGHYPNSEGVQRASEADRLRHTPYRPHRGSATTQPGGIHHVVVDQWEVVHQLYRDRCWNNRSTAGSARACRGEDQRCAQALAPARIGRVALEIAPAEVVGGHQIQRVGKCRDRFSQWEFAPAACPFQNDSGVR